MTETLETSAGHRFVGQRVARSEDARFLTGHGRYVDDITFPGMLHAAFARSDVARGRIMAIDVSAARELPGVVGVYTAWSRSSTTADTDRSASSPTATSASSASRS
jgi:carbon-monoxide dehydrogenase large subunit